MAEESKTKEHAEFAEALEALLPRAKELANTGKLDEALEMLLNHEKKTRVAGDAFSTAKVCVEIIKLCWSVKDLHALNAHVVLIAKRRAQLKEAVIQTVAEAMKYIPEVGSRDPKVELISSLRTVTDGKIYVEVERARLTKMLADLYESEGKIDKASETLQEVAVETFGAMDKKEKAEFLLEQVRLCLAQHDFIRMLIISNKVSKKVLDEEGFEEIKLRFYRLIVQLHSNKKEASSLIQDWQAIYTTRGVSEDDAVRDEALQHITVFLALAPFDNMVSDLRHRYLLDKNIDALPAYKSLLEHLTTPEIAPWPLPKDAELRAHPVLMDDEWYSLLRKRVMQHNIRVVSKYYSKIRFDRFRTLLGVETDEAESFLSEMVSEKFLYAKIDRPAGVVSFVAPRAPTEVLTDWSGDIAQLLGLVERTCHLINKENMVHGVKA